MILTFPGVYVPRSDTALLASAIADEVALARGARWLDVCSGTGALALAAARLGVTDVTAVDVSRRAVANIRVNAALARLPVRALRGNLFEPVGGERFGVIVSNPPYVPAATNEPARGAARAWDAGPDGRAILDRICSGALELLEPGGTLLLVQSSLSDVDRTRRMLTRRGMPHAIVRRHRGPLGPIAAARRELLRERGLLGPGDAEELVVLRAQAPGDAALAEAA